MEYLFAILVADVHWFVVDTGKRVREVHAMPVTIVTMEKPDKRSKNVYARIPRGSSNSSVDKDDEETFVCGTCSETIGRVEIEGECGATLVVCPAPILQQWQDEISRSFSTPYQYLCFDAISLLLSFASISISPCSDIAVIFKVSFIHIACFLQRCQNPFLFLGLVACFYFVPICESII